MSSILEFFQSAPVIALLIALLIFAITIFLVVKRWIGFSVTSLLLLFSLAAGLLINHQRTFHYYFSSPSSSSAANAITSEDSQDVFHKQMLQAVEDLKVEVNSEKENLRRVMNQIQEIFETVEAQKQKLQNFIEETRERFKTDYPSNQPKITTSNEHSEIKSEKETELNLDTHPENSS